MLRVQALLFFLVMGLAGCAGVNVQALDPTGNSASGQPGLRYYLPKPYLLVTQVPIAAGSSTEITGDKPPFDGSSNGTAGAGPKPSGGSATANPATTPKANSGGPEGGASTESTPASAAGTDLSYLHAGSGYQMKIIYLPDLRHPMAITMTAGIGSASAQPTLADGWMLTSLQASADSKLAENVASLASVLTAIKAPSSSSSGKAGGAGTAGAGMSVLPPGLYAFEYDASTGTLTSVCTVTAFASSQSAAVAPCKSATPTR